MLIRLLCLFTLACFANAFDHDTPTKSRDYIDFYQGSARTTVILSAPHGGWNRVSSYAIRQRGCYDSSTGTCEYNSRSCTRGYRKSGKCYVATGADLYTADLAKAIRNKIAEVTGEMPHLIVNTLHRSRLDPNREIDEASQGDANSERSFNTYHGFIGEAHELAKQNNVPGIHFDIHGYASHKDLWFELGYLIDSDDLDDNNIRSSDSSIRSLASRVPLSFHEILRGHRSLGGKFQAAGYKSVPSPRYPGPGSGIHGKYYRGGYTTRRWGSRDGGNIDAIQIEFPPEPRKGWREHGPKIGEIIGEFVNEHYQPHVLCASPDGSC